MGFFDNPLIMQIVGQHIKDVDNLTEEESKKLLRRYKHIRQELRDRLDYMPEGSFSAQKLRVILVQIDAALAANKESLLEGMKEGSTKASKLGIRNLIKEITKFSEEFDGAEVLVDLDAVMLAGEADQYLFNRYESSISAYTENTRANFFRYMSDAMIQQQNLSQVTQGLGKFMQAEEWRLMRLARTELHHVYNHSKQVGLFEYAKEDPKLMKGLFHPMDARTGEDSKKADRLNLVVPVDEPFEYTFQGKKRVFMTPPDRSNDRSVLIPYKKSWDQD